MSEELKQLKELMDNRNNAHSVWLRHYFLIIATVFGVLASLHSPCQYPYPMYIIHSLIISITGLAVLSAGIAAYYEVWGTRKLFQRYHSQLQKSIHDRKKMTEGVFLKPYKFFEVCEKISYMSFGISIIMLIIYSVFTDKI